MNLNTFVISDDIQSNIFQTVKLYLLSITRRPANTGKFFAQLQSFQSTFANSLKKSNVLSLFFKGFQHTSIPPLIFTTPGIFNLPGRRSKVLNTRYSSESLFENLNFSCEILIVEFQTKPLEKISLTIGKSHYKSHFGQIHVKDHKGRKNNLEYVYRVTLYTIKNVH